MLRLILYTLMFLLSLVLSSANAHAAVICETDSDKLLTLETPNARLGYWEKQEDTTLFTTGLSSCR